ncbi:hypothetical protein J7384_17015 [Endozoicomonas sp. G2_1]|uniref:hypothetical protein n=1 Tax=Endozoicomonas sp. G2_1 TaxID=2821091 RepID=UPI001ADD1834|nr:hypothetical protein [Endozoicomonas sp. G2_1]MBO9492065.1 hypothetical protein [Endozoicomonas sp. G2_1]
MNKFQPFVGELTKLAKATGVPDLIEQLKTAQEKGEAIIYSEPHIGFLAVKPTFRDDELVLFVWVGISRMTNGLKHGVRMCQQMASETACKAVEFETSRKGFKRIAGRMGFIPKARRNQFITYRKEVNNGRWWR